MLWPKPTRVVLALMASKDRARARAELAYSMVPEDWDPEDNEDFSQEEIEEMEKELEKMEKELEST